MGGSLLKNATNNNIIARKQNHVWQNHIFVISLIMACWYVHHASLSTSCLMESAEIHPLGSARNMVLICIDASNAKKTISSVMMDYALPILHSVNKLWMVDVSSASAPSC